MLFHLIFHCHMRHLGIILRSLAKYLAIYGTLWMRPVLKCYVPRTTSKPIDEKNVRLFPAYSFKNSCECRRYPVLLVITVSQTCDYDANIETNSHSIYFGAQSTQL